MSKRPELEVANGVLAGQRFAVPATGLRLGRSSSNDIKIPDEELSRNHCLFEVAGEDGIRVTDLASANGTIVNGSELGNDPALLKVGDVIEVGATVVRVVGDAEAAKPAGAKGGLRSPVRVAKGASLGAVDLGLGSREPGAGEGKPARRRSPLVKVLWPLAVLCAAGAIYVVLVAPALEKPAEAPAEATEEAPVVREVRYEKVEADSTKIYRYEMTLSPDNVLRVTVDNVPGENRHLAKSQALDEKALAELNEILAFKALREIDREYVGVEPDPPALDSSYLKVVYSTRARSVRVVNAPEPEAFRAIREKLETFSKNQLGVWALQYSREKLVALAEEATALGRTKWEDRDVQHGNLFGAVKAYEEALFYLETVNPKPECWQTARKGLEAAKTELDQRYANQRFLADRAINLKQWGAAQRELSVLLELVPDRSDDRNREASAKLVDVERRMKGGN